MAKSMSIILRILQLLFATSSAIGLLYFQSVQVDTGKLVVLVAASIITCLFGFIILIKNCHEMRRREPVVGPRSLEVILDGICLILGATGLTLALLSRLRDLSFFTFTAAAGWLSVALSFFWMAILLVTFFMHFRPKKLEALPGAKGFKGDALSKA